MLITLVLLISAVIFLFVGYRLKSWQVIGYAFASVLVFSALHFAQDNPNVKVSTPYLTLEQKVETLAVTQKQLQDTVTTLTEMILVTEDGVAKLGEGKAQRDKLIHKLQEKLKSQIPENELKKFNHDLEILNKPN